MIFDTCLQPLMLIVPDIHDVYTPLQTDVIVPVSEVSHLDSYSLVDLFWSRWPKYTRLLFSYEFNV